MATMLRYPVFANSSDLPHQPSLPKNSHYEQSFPVGSATFMFNIVLVSFFQMMMSPLTVIHSNLEDFVVLYMYQI